ncbi:hypothetical protein KUCAC02_009714, partial [Chaenocephalus aceratus]
VMAFCILNTSWSSWRHLQRGQEPVLIGLLEQRKGLQFVSFSPKPVDLLTFGDLRDDDL